MSLEREKSVRQILGMGKAFLILILLSSLCGVSSPAAQEQHAKRPFTVKDDIGFTHFVSTSDAYGSAYLIQTPTQFSPNGEFVAVLTARGRLDLNEVEETLRFYRTKEIEAFLEGPADAQPPAPIWAVNRSDKEETINGYQWLGDSSGVALLEKTENGYSQRIVLADLRKKTTEVLISHAGSWGDSFDIARREHYIYFAADEADRKEAEKIYEEEQEAERRAPMKVFNGSVWDLVLPERLGGVEQLLADKKRLWLVDRGQRSEVKPNGAPFKTSDFSPSTLVMSPDGQSLVTKQRVKVPPSWEKLYLPPYARPENNIHEGASVFEYVLLDLKTGAVKSLTEAPLADEAGWFSGDGSPSWSRDGQSVVLADTFIPAKGGVSARPCVAVVDLDSNTRSCVERLKARKGKGLDFEEGYHYIQGVRFTAGDKNRVEVFYSNPATASVGMMEYQRTSKNDWQVAEKKEGWYEGGPKGLEITVKESMDEPPVLMASRKQTTRVILDPNPGFKDIDWGEVKVYQWKDKDGRNWKGGLYLPVGYQKGQRYPLVIQNHGFTAAQFLPSGGFPTAFAAREFAAAGIAVLQIEGGVCPQGSADEGPCNREAFEAGVKEVIAEGLVDPDNVGYIGFSRTCYYGMEMLTNGSLPLKAALLADGVTVDFFEFTLFGLEEFNQLIGAKPFGDGLETWVKRSPGFHMDKVTAPVEIAAEKDGAIQMWQPYALLRYLHKPVEFTLMNSDEHVVTNPAERLASQGLSVDWFRFWMQGYEDPDPAKAEQYKRWHELRKMQESGKTK